MLGLGYPGGAALERLAEGGDPQAFTFPGPARTVRAAEGDERRDFEQGLDFSFAGLKTALLYRLRERPRWRCPRGRSGGLLPGSDRRQPDRARRTALQATGLDRLAVGRGRGRQRRVAQAAEGARRDAAHSATRAVHRQRRDDRERRALRRASAIPGVPGARRLRDGRSTEQLNHGPWQEQASFRVRAMSYSEPMTAFRAPSVMVRLLRVSGSHSAWRLGCRAICRC